MKLRAAVTLAASAFMSFGAPAHADTEATLVPTEEAWYQPNPTCATPLGCSPAGALPPASLYPSGTLHVGVSGGRETARSYLALSLTSLTGTVSAASLTVPLDTTAADGDTTSAAAKVQVCLTFDAVAPVEGSFDPPPSADCAASALADYVSTPEPHLHADLAPLLGRLSSASGIVLLPDPASTPTDTWRVVFSAHDRNDGATTAPASLSVTFEDASPDTATDPFEPLPLSGSAVFGAVDPPVGTGFAAPAVDLPGVEGAAPTASPGTSGFVPSPIVTARHRYPVVWLFPLVLLVLVPAVSGALTKDLTVPSSTASEVITSNF